MLPWQREEKEIGMLPKSQAAVEYGLLMAVAEAWRDMEVKLSSLTYMKGWLVLAGVIAGLLLLYLTLKK